MRTLTILRRKSFAACLAKTHIYVEDSAAADEVLIQNVPCSKLGTLKNGEEKCFSVAEQELRIFAIADLASRDYCCEMIRIPAGTEAVSLTGQHHFGPASGNAFRFDGNESEEAGAIREAGRKKGKRVVAAALIVGAVAGVFGGFFGVRGLLGKNRTPQPKDFQLDHLTVTLNDTFRLHRYDDGCFAESRDTLVFSIDLPYSENEELRDCTMEELTELLVNPDEEIRTENGQTCFFYLTEEDGSVSANYDYMYQTDSAVVLLCVEIPAGKAEEMEPEIAGWAGTVRTDP